jgi:hypothetical protein
VAGGLASFIPRRRVVWSLRPHQHSAGEEPDQDTGERRKVPNQSPLGLGRLRAGGVPQPRGDIFAAHSGGTWGGRPHRDPEDDASRSLFPCYALSGKCPSSSVCDYGPTCGRRDADHSDRRDQRQQAARSVVLAGGRTALPKSAVGSVVGWANGSSPRFKVRCGRPPAWIAVAGVGVASGCDETCTRMPIA